MSHTRGKAVSLFRRIKDAVAPDAWTGAAVWIPDNRVYPLPEPEQPPIVADASYFRLWRAGAKLEQTRAWFSDWHPAVHAVVSRDFGHISDEVVAVIAPTS